MAITIKDESVQLKKALSDIDKYRLRYYTKEIDEDTDTNITINFVSPYIQIWEDYKYYLLKNSDYITISPTKFYRPDYVSYDLYKSTNLWSMLLYINDIYTIEEFTKDRILAPTKSAIIQLSKNGLIRKVPEEVVRSTKFPNEETASLFYPKHQPELRPIVVTTSDPINKFVYFEREQFVVNQRTIDNRFIDLKTEPVINSIVLRVEGNPPFLINKDYKLINSICADNLGKKRISWNNSRYQELTTRLESSLEVGIVLEVQYSAINPNLDVENSAL